MDTAMGHCYNYDVLSDSGTIPFMNMPRRPVGNSSRLLLSTPGRAGAFSQGAAEAATEHGR